MHNNSVCYRFLLGSVPGILLASVACAGEGTEPNVRALVGQWGSRDAELIGLHSGAELRIPCTTIIIDDAILLTDSNDFTVRAQVDGPGLTVGSLPVIHLTGHVAGDQVTVRVPSGVGTSAATYLLEAGVAPAPEDEPACPL